MSTGSITSQGDVDTYELGRCSGAVRLTASPSAVGSDLDIDLRLLDATGQVVSDVNPPMRVKSYSVATGLDNVGVDVSVVLGRSRMPIHKLLRMGRGAVIALDSSENDEVEILANYLPIARGIVVVNGTSITVEVKELIRRPPSETLDEIAAEGGKAA